MAVEETAAAVASSQLTSNYLINLTVDNIHCSSCVSYARDVLRSLPGLDKIDISIIEHIIRVQYAGDICFADIVVNELGKSAFEVRHVQVISIETGKCIKSYVLGEDNASPRLDLPRWRFLMTRAQKSHLDHCNLCQDQLTAGKPSLWHVLDLLLSKRMKTRHNKDFDIFKSDQDRGKMSSRTLPVIPAAASRSILPDVNSEVQIVFEATILIEGMSCASCVSTITHAVEALQGVESIMVNLVENTALVRFYGPESRSGVVITTIQEVGFDATLSEIKVVKNSKQFDNDPSEAIIRIAGMKDASCIGIIKRELENLSFVLTVDINLLTNNAFVHFYKAENSQKLLESIIELGYDASIIQIKKNQTFSQEDHYEERIVEFDIAGMYCPQCPPKFVQALVRFGYDQVSVLQSPSIKRPAMKVVYKPDVPAFTIRTLLHHLNAVDPACRVSVHQTVTIEQRSLEVRQRERNRIMRHLFVTFLVAIPSFILGVVFMSLVPGTNKTKIFLEQSLFAGQATRMEWALFITTTPAYFYGGALFHSKALKEIYSLWRPQSKVPLLRRFYRFGSMNLLISAGTSVAYFSSLAVMIMDATIPQSRGNANFGDGSMPKQSATYFDTATFLILFILVGRYLEAHSKAKTSDAVSMLRSLQPQHALLVGVCEPDIDKGTLRTVSVSMLEVGDTVSVPHGMCPPTDGTITQEGSFLFDESSLTGESQPTPKGLGDKVLTGSKNVSAPVQIRVTNVGGQSILDQIVNIVREGQATRAPIERLADTLTGYFTPFVTLAAITTWIVWLGLGEGGILPDSWLDVNRGGWPFWSLQFAIAVFVVACPCGIGLAAPTALFVGGGLAAKNGILAQGGGEAFQEASKLDTIVFDKTGTLTEGKLKVIDVEFLDAIGDKEDDVMSGNHRNIMLSLAYALESHSNHPIAKAVTTYCSDYLLSSTDDKINIMEIQETPGKGMKGVCRLSSDLSAASYEVLIGSEALLHVENSSNNEAMKQFESLEISPSSNFTVYSKLPHFQASGCSIAILAARKIMDKTITPLSYRPVAIFAVADSIRPDATKVLRALRSKGIETYMCTGDNPITARAIASQLDIPVTNIRAGMLPQDKATFIKDLQFPPRYATLQSTTDNSKNSMVALKKRDESRRIVAFVGDGTNDSPALTVADVSIAIAHPSSSDVALTSASFILLSSNLSSILTLVALSRRVFRRVKFNFFWAAVYNVCLIPVAAGVFFPVNADWDLVRGHSGFKLNPVWAAAAMAGSSVSVVLSSLALKLPEIRYDAIIRKLLFWQKFKFAK